MDILLERIAAKQNYANYTTHIREVSSGGANISSTLFLVELRAEGKPDLKLFVKVAAWNEKKRQSAPISCPYTTELYFYRKVQKHYQKIEDKYCIPDEHRVRMPKVYGTSDEYLTEIVVLENLTAQGFENYDREKPADFEYMSTAIEQMAKFHALSLAYHEDDPEDFALASETLKYDVFRFHPFMPDLVHMMLDNALNVAVSVHVAKLKKYFAEDHRLWQYLDVYRNKKRNILLHGDFKPSNLMHRRQNGKLEIVLVDFQMVRDGDPVMDLLYFIYTATDEQLRRDHYHALLDEYYKHLRAALHRLNLDPERVYSEETYREELKQCTMMGLVIAVVLLPVILADEEESQGSEIKQSKADVDSALADVALVVKGSPLFTERFNGILNNYVEWGLL